MNKCENIFVKWSSEINNCSKYSPKKVKIYIIILYFIILLINFVRAQNQQFEPNSYKCKDFQITLDYRRHYLNVKCLNKNPKNLQDIPSFKKTQLRKKNIHFYDCQFNKNVTISKIIERLDLQVTSIFLHAEEKQNIIIDSNSSYFGELESITWVDMDDYLIIKDPPCDFFKGMPILNHLSIKSNITLNTKVYLQLENLERLYWKYTNQILHLKNDTFPIGLVLKTLVISYDTYVIIEHDSLPDIDYTLRIEGTNTYSCLSIRTPEHLEYTCNTTDTEVISAAYRTLFKTVEYIESLQLIGCGIRILAQDMFYDFKEVKEISLERNAISHVPEYLFYKMAVLEEIDLSFNKISEIPVQLFLNLKKVKGIRLDNNKLTYISNVVFSTVPSLETLHLQNNEIHQFDPRALRSCTQLRLLDISHNMLNNSLVKLILPDYLEEVNMSFNNISTSKMLLKLQTLEYLDYLYLSNNKLHNISINMLLLKRNYYYIDLQNNDINHIRVCDTSKRSSKIYKNNDNENEILLNNNPLECSCQLYFLLKFKENYTNWYFNFGNSICEKNSLLSGQLINSIKSNQVICNMKEVHKDAECPIHCSCLYQHNEDRITVNCSDKGLSILPAPLPQVSSRNVDLLLNNNNLTVIYKADLQYNNVTLLRLDNNQISAVLWLPPNLKFLELHMNQLTYLNESTISLLNESSSLIKTTFYDNPWSCSCENKYLLNFLKENYDRSTNQDNITCDNYLILNTLTENDICQSEHVEQNSNILFLLIPVGIIFIAILILIYKKELIVLLYSYKICMCCFFGNNDIDEGKEYDAFVSYSHEDGEFVALEVIPKLEHECSYRLCVPERDWLGGELIADKIYDSIKTSRRTLIILTPNFITNVWGKTELKMAYLATMREKRPKIIVVLLKDVGPIKDLEPELQAYLTKDTYIARSDRLFWEKLCYALRHRTRPAKTQETNDFKVSYYNIVQQPTIELVE